MGVPHYITVAGGASFMIYGIWRWFESITDCMLGRKRVVVETVSSLETISPFDNEALLKEKLRDLRDNTASTEKLKHTLLEKRDDEESAERIRRRQETLRDYLDE